MNYLYKMEIGNAFSTHIDAAQIVMDDRGLYKKVKIDFIRNELDHAYDVLECTPNGLTFESKYDCRSTFRPFFQKITVFMMENHDGTVGLYPILSKIARKLGLTPL